MTDNAGPPSLKSGFTFDISPSYPSAVERDISRHLGPGLYRVVLYVEAGGPRQNREPIDEIEFTEVQSHEDVPNIEADYLTQLLVARMDNHNEQAACGPLKYAVKFLTKRSRNQPALATWSTIVRDFATVKQQENDGLPPLDLHMDPDRMVMAQYGGAFSELRMVVSDMRADRAEHRADMAQSWEIIRDQQTKILELSTKHLDHQEHQAKVNEAGWEALHTGIDMQKRVSGELEALRRDLEMTRMKLMAAEHELRAAGREQFIETIGPAAAGQAAKMLEQKGKGGFLSNALKMLALGSMPGLPGMIPGMPMPGAPQRPAAPAQAASRPAAPQPQPQPSATNGGATAAPQVPQVDITEICTPEELSDKPLTCLGRFLGATFTHTQLQTIETTLLPEEWQDFKIILGAPEDVVVFASAIRLYASLAKDDARMQKLAAALTDLQQQVMNMIADRISGTTKGPLDTAGLSTKPVDKDKVLVQAMEQNRRMAAQVAEQERQLAEMRSQLEARSSAPSEEKEEPVEDGDEEIEAEESDEPPPTPSRGRKKTSRRSAET